MFQAIWKVGGVFITAAMIVLMVLALAGALIWRFALISFKPSLFYFCLGIILVVGAGLLTLYGQWGGKFFGIAGTILLAIGLYKAAWPNTSTATTHAQEVADIQAAMALNSQVAPKAVRCDRESGTQYWDQVTGEAKVFYFINDETKRIDCADRNGYNAFTRQQYKPVIAEIVKVIMKQDPPASPSPAPTPEPTRVAATPEPTPLPDLSDVISEVTPDSGWTPVQQDPK